MVQFYGMVLATMVREYRDSYRFCAMKIRLAALLLALTTGLALPAAAQNRSQIDSVLRGQSCAGCNLFQGSFSGLSGNGINLAGARLRQSDLSLATLNRARLNGTDMRDVEAYGAVFSGANFSGANLSNASFVGTWLQGASFSNAILEGTNFSGADLSRATGLTQRQLNLACGDEATKLPSGLQVSAC